MKPFVVYTAMIGEYDEIHQPLVVDDRFDYVLFTDEITQPQIGVWQVRKVEYTNPDKIRIARYVKTHPEKLLSGYNATLWMDSNIQIATNYLYEKVQSLYDCGVEWASLVHPERDCIYDEAYYVMSHCLLVLETDIFKWCHLLKKEHFPHHFGLYETGITYRRTCDVCTKINKLWWMCICSFSRRDQLSHMYAIWHYPNVVRADVLPGADARTSDEVNYFDHSVVSKRKFVYTDAAEIRRARYRDFDWCRKFNKKLYFALYSLPYTPHIFLKCWEIVMGVIYQVYKRKRNK